MQSELLPSLSSIAEAPRELGGNLCWSIRRLWRRDGRVGRVGEGRVQGAGVGFAAGCIHLLFPLLDRLSFYTGGVVPHRRPALPSQTSGESHPPIHKGPQWHQGPGFAVTLAPRCAVREEKPLFGVAREGHETKSRGDGDRWAV